MLTMFRMVDSQSATRILRSLSACQQSTAIDRWRSSCLLTRDHYDRCFTPFTNNAPQCIKKTSILLSIHKTCKMYPLCFIDGSVACFGVEVSQSICLNVSLLASCLLSLGTASHLCLSNIETDGRLLCCCLST